MRETKEFELNNEGCVFALYSRERETANTDPYLDPPHPSWIELPASSVPFDWPPKPWSPRNRTGKQSTEARNSIDIHQID